MCSSGDVRKIFGDIVRLKVGEALVFSPNAMIGYSKNASGMKVIHRLGLDYVKIKVRLDHTLPENMHQLIYLFSNKSAFLLICKVFAFAAMGIFKSSKDPT